MDQRLINGIALFNQKEFFEAHEVIEELWRETDGELKNFYRGLIQAAAALHHLKRGTFKGGLEVCKSAIALLKPYTPVTLGVQVQKLVDDLKTSFEQFEKLNSQEKIDLENLPFPSIQF